MPSIYSYSQHRPPPPLSPVYEDALSLGSHPRRPSMSSPNLSHYPLGAQSQVSLVAHPEMVQTRDPHRPLSYPPRLPQKVKTRGMAEGFRGSTNLREWEMFYPPPPQGTVTVASSLSEYLDDDRVPFYRRPWCIILYIFVFCTLIGVGVAVGILFGSGR